MNKLKKVLSVLCAFALLSVFVFEVSGTSAYAQQEDKNIVAEEDIIKLTDVLKKEDVSQSNIDNLIEKFKKGESFDCYKKESFMGMSTITGFFSLGYELIKLVSIILIVYYLAKISKK